MTMTSLSFIIAAIASLLPARHWRKLPSHWSMGSATFMSGIATMAIGFAIGFPGFLTHARLNASMATNVQLDFGNLSHRFGTQLAGLSIFTYLFTTLQGLLALYLLATGAGRAAAAWFEDPVGDPVLSGIDRAACRSVQWWRARRIRAASDALQGPEVPDRVVTPERAGVFGCDLVIVASRKKPEWESGVVVYTSDGCYRIGEAIERVVNGNVRTLYPLTAHNDLEVVRRSVQYDLPRNH